MEQTIVTLLIAAGGAVFGVLVIAGGYLAARAAVRDANGILHKAPTPEPDLYGSRPQAPRRSGTKSERPDPVRAQQSMILELQRTRSILLGWLSVLEAFALGDAWRATALRAELGDINTCDVSLVGDANVIATYQLTVDMLRNQAGRGLPPDVASQMASIRVRLLTALAEQERRLNHGERPLIAEPLGHLDLWGPPRPITEVISRPAAESQSRPALGEGSGSASSSANDRLPSYPPPAAAQPLVIRSVAPAPSVPAAVEEPNRLIASSTTGATEARIQIPPTSTPAPTPTTSQPEAAQPAASAEVTAESTPARPLRTPEGAPKSSAPKSSAPKSSAPKAGRPKSSGLKTSKPAPGSSARITTEPAAKSPAAQRPAAQRPAATPPATKQSPTKQPTMRPSSRPMLRALPDPAGPNRGGRGTTGALTPASPQPAPPQAAPPQTAPPQPAPAKPTPSPAAATKPVGAPASRRTTSAVAKPAAPTPRKPASSASGPMGPAAMSAKPAVRSTARRSVP